MSSDKTTTTATDGNVAPAGTSTFSVVNKTSPFAFFAMDPFSALLSVYRRYHARARSYVYDAVILGMTELWYRSVLERLEDGSVLLDVGVGTAGALLRCSDLIKSKSLTVVGVDIDTAYVEAARLAYVKAGMSDRLYVCVANVYDGPEKTLEMYDEAMTAMAASGGGVDGNGHVEDQNQNEGKRRRVFDAVYFSGSFSLLPDPVGALRLASELVRRPNGEAGGDVDGEKGCGGGRGDIYITQTYQRRTPFFLPYIKPLMKFVTTIDFGQLVREADVLRTFEESGLKLAEHAVIPGSVDNSLQAAYLTVLMAQGP